MAVVTRSKAAKQLRTRRISAAMPGRSVRRTQTRVIVTASATGQGTHTRWLRRERRCSEANSSAKEADIDERFITPAPSLVQVPAAPQKAKIPTHAPLGTPPRFVLDNHLEQIAEEHIPVAQPDLLGSPFTDSSSTRQGLQRQETVHSFGSPHATESTVGKTNRSLRRAYGPNGTYLLDAEGKDVWVP